MKEYKIIKILIIYLPFVIFGLFGVVLISNQFVSFSNDSTTPITNLGFAILAAISAICFSWSNSLPSEHRLKYFARMQGQRSFLAAIIFLLGSGMKFTLLNIEKILPFINSSIIHVIQSIFTPFIGFIFSFSIFLTFWILFRISLQLWEGFDLTKKFPE